MSDTQNTPPDSTPADDGGDCAEIPTAAHAVLTAEIKLLVRIPRPPDVAQQMPHKFTLTSDDGSVSQTLTMSGAEAGDIDGTSMLTFTGLAEHHSYSLQCDNGEATYMVFEGEAYEQMGEPDDDAAPAGSDSSGGEQATSDSATTA
jgi:hypothetical protein